jgi:ElaB/YqjD/DUF883 family membrane-anchored ribosome-binding protein
MTSTNSSGGEPGEIQAQIAQLREQVDALMNENETRTVGCPMCAGCKICSAARATRQHAEKLASNIREQPLLALLIAGAAGFLVGRALR